MKLHSISLRYLFLKTSSLIIILFLIAFDFFSCNKKLNFNQQQFPYNLKPIRAAKRIPSGEQFFLFYDIDGDGADEQIEYISKISATPQNPNRMLIFDWAGQHLFADQENIKGYVLGFGCFSFDGGLQDKIILFELFEQQVYLNIYQVEKRKISLVNRCQVTGIPVPHDIKSPGSFFIRPVEIHDWNYDGKLDIIAAVNTSYGYQPRGLWIINLETGETTYKLPVGPGGINPVLFDLDADGKKEIIIGSSAYNNCKDVPVSQRKVNGTDDSQSWLFMVDDNEQLILKRAVAGQGTDTRPFVSDMNNDGKPEVIIIVSDPTTNGKGTIYFLDLATKKLLKDRYRFEKISNYLKFFDLFEDGKSELLVHWADGLLEVRDFQNHVIDSIRTPITQEASIKIVDIEKDGTEEICIFGRTGILFLDARLNILSYEPIFVSNFQEVSPNLSEPYFFHIESENQTRIYKLERNIGQVLQLPTLIVLSFFMGIVVTLLGIVLYIKKSRKSDFLTETIYPNSATLVIDSDGRLNELNENTEQLLDVKLKNARGFHISTVLSDSSWNKVAEIVVANLRSQSQIRNKEIMIYQQGEQRHLLLSLIPGNKPFLRKRLWLLRIIDITDLVKSKRAIAWAGMAQRLAHEIKTPLSSVMLAAQQLQSLMTAYSDTAEKSTEYLQYIMEQVHRLRATTDVFMKFAHLTPLNFQPTAIKSIIESVLDEIKTIIPKTISIQTELQLDLPTILVDHDEIAIAFKNIFENAINAIKDQGTLTVSTRLVQLLQNNQPGIAIEISDTGKGIPENELEKIFEPFFSKSEGGTGLGLTLVKKIIDDHEGTIDIRSEIGIGTTVIVTLPVKIREDFS